MTPSSKYTKLDWDALKRIHDHFAGKAFEICAEGKEIHPQIFVLNAHTDDPLGKIVCLSDEMVRGMMESDKGKEALGRLMRDLLNQKSTVARHHEREHGFFPGILIQINEAWASKPRPGRKQLAPSEDPNRTEVLIIVLHTRDGSIPVMHEIVSNPDRHCVVGEFPEQSHVPEMAGRMAIAESDQNQKDESVDTIHGSDAYKPSRKPWRPTLH